MGKEDPNKQGESTAEWRARTGRHTPLDTGRLRALDGASDAEETKSEASGEDPYNRTFPPLDTTVKTRRRSLDDMRHLSETIKAGRFSK
jgi:hypothetical protein